MQKVIGKDIMFIRLNIFFSFIFIFLLINQVAASEVKIYRSYPDAQKSDVFTVSVNDQKVFVEKLPVREGDLYYKFPHMKELSYHCTRFAFSGKVVVRVETSGSFDTVRLRPESAGISLNSNNSTIEFIMSEPKNLLLQLGWTWLYIFADPLEKNVPKPDNKNSKVLNILDYNVDNTGQNLCTFEIQRAIIDVATGPNPGGVLYFPRGVYRTGTIRLYSGVTLFLEDGALIQASFDPADFPLPFGVKHGPPNRDYGYEYALIQIHHAKNVSIQGHATIDGGGTANGRLKLVHIENSHNVTVKDVVIRNGYGWMFPILYSEHIRVKNIKLISPITSNTDGFDPDSVIDCVIDGCFVCTGDDPIVVKSTNFGLWLKDETKNIRIKNNSVLTMKSGLKVGTETSARRMYDITFENNDVLIADRAFAIYVRDGATVENISFINNRVEIPGGLRSDRDRIIDISINARGEDIWQHPQYEIVKKDPGKIRNILFQDISISITESQYLTTSKIQGYDSKNNISDVIFRNISINGQKITKPETPIKIGQTGKRIPFMSIDTETVSDVSFE